jgi:hypothetical protein
VSKSGRIATLEALLARVRSRAGEPRESRQSLAVASPLLAAVPAALPSEPPPGDEIDAVTIPPPPALLRQPAPPPMRAALPTETDVVVDVDVLQEAVGDTVIGVAAEEAGTGQSPRSRERLVAAEPAMGLVVQMPAPEPLPEEPPDLLTIVERIEETPVSSRRPVATEPEKRLSDMAYGAEEEEESLPRHTPPPESGRMAAAPSSGDPDADVTGVRESPVMAPRGLGLIPEEIRADLAPHDAVADMVGEAQPFAPTTFAGLLDASMAL